MTRSKTIKMKHSKSTARSTPEEKLLAAIFGEPAILAAGKRHPAELSEIWEKEQAKVVGGEVVSLGLQELRPWTTRFTAAEINELVIPKRTLARRKTRHESLTPEETDRALRLARISAEADRVFGGHEKSARWLRKPNSALSGQTPLELLKSEIGALAVDELLNQIDHGMFA